MESLDDLVPEHDPVKDAALSVGSALVGTIPVVGGAIGQVGAGLIASRQAARQHEFDQAVARVLEDLAQQVEELTPQAILDSDEFMAAYSHASRVAAETASKGKRERLASALRHAGPWSSVPNDRRTRFLTLVAEYEDIDVAVLHYLASPEMWLLAHSAWKPGRYLMVSMISVMDEHFFAEHEDWKSYLPQTLSRLTRDGLVVDSGWNTIGTESGTISTRTTTLGDAFLAFLE